MATMAARKTGWAKRLKDLRTALDLTQKEAAERLGVPLRTWIGWENPGKRKVKPSAMAIRALLDEFSELND